MLGCAGVGWGLLTFPIFARNGQIEPIAEKILRGDAFQPQRLSEQLGALRSVESQSYCYAPAARNTAIISLRIAETSLTNPAIGHIDENIAAATAAVKSSLSCDPVDSYLWLSLFWLKAVGSGTQPKDLDLLRMSYAQGPNEGWVMTKRNHLALAMFSSLPPDLAEQALAEFAKMLKPEFVAVAADNFVGPGWPIHDKLLDRIRDLPESARRDFAETLAIKGYQIDVPGIDLAKRPFH
jgi:hypothetical protein